MAQRRGGIGPPKEYVVSGEWPDGAIEGPSAALVAQQLARSLAAATKEMSLRQVAAATGVDHTTVRDVLQGNRWPDLLTIVKLEEGLHVDIWPARSSRS